MKKKSIEEIAEELENIALKSGIIDKPLDEESKQEILKNLREIERIAEEAEKNEIETTKS